MAFAAFVRVYFGIDLGVDELTANAVIGALTAAFVWLVPNKEPRAGKMMGRFK